MVETEDKDAFELVTTGFYRGVDPALAGPALRHWLGLLAPADEQQLGRLMVLFYLFGRISQVSEPARSAFAPILRAYTGKHAEVAQGLLGVSSTSKFPNALELPIQGPEVLDMLWAEFFVTGTPDPIVRLFTPLDGEDRSRKHLDHWLRETSFFGGWKRRKAAATLAEHGLLVDLDAKRILTTGDLDCLLWSIAERKIPIFRLVPFELTPAELTGLSIKASALWSLRLNAKTHDVVAEVCRVEGAKPGGLARRLAIGEATRAERPFAL